MSLSMDENKFREIIRDEMLIDKAVLSMSECCRFTSLSESSIKKHIKHNGFPYKKIGKRIFFERKKVEDWMLNYNESDQHE
jgi:predicted DNA-binding transcriptional regulator AlpA